MRFTGQFVQLKLDQARFVTELREQLQKQLQEAASAWLAAVLGRVPLWSGMARASLLKLSRLINGTIILSPLKDISRIPQGEILGTATQEYTDTTTKITITTDVPHYNLQEYSKAPEGGSPSAPWHSLEAGKIAFDESAKKMILPTPKIQTSTIRV